MNRDDVIRMAREAGFNKTGRAPAYYAMPEEIERFAALVAAAAVEREREACARWLEDVVDAPNWAEQIRARGQA